jgi:flagellar hook-associated protein 3 FlgL
MLYGMAIRDGGKARERLESAAAQAATGQKLVHPGDDPAGAGLVSIDHGAAARLDAIREVASRASDELAAVDTSLGEVSNDLIRAREIAMQFSSAGYSAAQRAGAAVEVRGLIASSVASLNARAGGRYVFAGRLDGAPPFDAAGNYTGDAGVRQVEIAPGVLQDASVRADVAVAGVGGGTNLFATLNALVTALDANDQNAVAATLAGLDASTGQISIARAQAGTSMSILDTAVAESRATADEARARAATFTDADAVEAAGRLAMAQRALEAALTATSSSFKLTILDYLR